MNNVNTTNAWLSTSIELFIHHYKYGYNYEDSTVLIDWEHNIIAFFDRWTENIDRIMCEINHNGLFIIANWIGYETDKFYKMEAHNKLSSIPSKEHYINFLTNIYEDLRCSKNE